ncbi:hypothetical protein Pcinc_000105 [Petrolisthes cinctipes]|uniref:Uncharacterized protein n=1 Tax=Petrolisthes cinctipes TaxID=88211 RepID=A0AAE1L521_PETCI|nr:hypothetical protein Pcinc_000105 [Petrolisthes cinctipes]
MEARRKEARERRIGFRGRIVGMHEAGQSIQANANNLGISTRTVLRWIRSIAWKDPRGGAIGEPSAVKNA